MNPFERFRFPGAFGDELDARLDLPAEGQASKAAIFAHCFTCGKNLNAVRHLAESLNAAGIAVLRFDFTGLGGSGGDFANTNFSSNVEDLVRAVQHLERERGLAPRLLIGHSLGGAAALRAALQLPSIRAVVTIGAPFEPDHVVHNFSCALSQIEAEGQAEVELGSRRFTIRQQFLDDVRAQAADQGASIAALKRPLLVMHAPLDQTVGIEAASSIFLAAKHPKSFVSLDGADHLLSRNVDAHQVGALIAAWASPYLA